jgi:hypothetical protein
MRCATQRILLGSFILIAFTLTGCQTMKAEPSKGAGFVSMNEMQK